MILTCKLQLWEAPVFSLSAEIVHIIIFETFFAHKLRTISPPWCFKIFNNSPKLHKVAGLLATQANFKIEFKATGQSLKNNINNNCSNLKASKATYFSFFSFREQHTRSSCSTSWFSISFYTGFPFWHKPPHFSRLGTDTKERLAYDPLKVDGF